MPADFRLRFPLSEVLYWASRYAYADDAEVEAIGDRARERGWFTRDEFLTVARWKSPRSRKRCEENDASVVKDITQRALSSPDERQRIEIFTQLRGVEFPTASVLLHLAHRDPYPVIDYRAVWSLGVESPPATHSFAFWWAYTQACRSLAMDAGVRMRTFDRAMWQFSKEHQPPKGTPSADPGHDRLTGGRRRLSNGDLWALTRTPGARRWLKAARPYSRAVSDATRERTHGHVQFPQAGDRVLVHSGSRADIRGKDGASRIPGGSQPTGPVRVCTPDPDTGWRARSRWPPSGHRRLVRPRRQEGNPERLLDDCHLREASAHCHRFDQACHEDGHPRAAAIRADCGLQGTDAVRLLQVSDPKHPRASMRQMWMGYRLVTLLIWEPG